MFSFDHFLAIFLGTGHIVTDAVDQGDFLLLPTHIFLKVKLFAQVYWYNPALTASVPL